MLEEYNTEGKAAQKSQKDTPKCKKNARQLFRDLCKIIYFWVTTPLVAQIFTSFCESFTLNLLELYAELVAVICGNLR